MAPTVLGDLNLIGKVPLVRRLSVRGIRKIEFVATYDKIASGKGGYWEDQGYEWYAGI